MIKNTAPLDKKRSEVSPFLVVLLILSVLALAASLAVTDFWKSYTPDPDANINSSIDTDTGDSVPGIVTPDYENDVFAGKTQAAGRYNFLIVGLDKVSRCTDIMMIVSYDVKRGQINVVGIPRDTYVRTADVKNVCKINSYYAVYYNRAVAIGSDNPEQTALTGLAALCERTLGVRINYCAAVDLEGFSNIVDAVGGVWLNIPEDMFYEDPYQNLYIDLKAGYQHLDGEHAMQFVRFRKGYVQQDLGRQDALKNFMASFMAQMKENLNVSTVVGVASEVMKNLRSNISAVDFVYFARSALSVDLSEVKMVTLPGEAAMVDGASVYVIYRDDTVAMINKYLNVFDTELAADEFDPDSVMYKRGDEKTEDIYKSPLGTAADSEYNAEDVNSDPIDIPRY